MEPELKPCPFCGAKATINRMERSSNFYRCECSHCDVRTGWMFGNGAISIWNTRVYPPEVQVAVDRNNPQKPRIEKFVKGSFLLCPNCDGDSFLSSTYKYCPHCGQKLDWGRDD